MMEHSSLTFDDSMSGANATPQAAQRSSPSHTTSSVALPVNRTLPSHRHHELDGLSFQNRCLALRKRGLRAPMLYPGRNVSPILDACSSRSEQAHCAENNDDAVEDPPEKTFYGDRSPPSPLDILKGIGNSTRGRRKLRRPSLAGILEDSTAFEDTRRESPSSACNGDKLLHSPSDILKEISNSAQRRRSFRRPSLGGILEDSTAVQETHKESPTNRLDEDISPHSPIDVLKGISHSTRERQSLQPPSLAGVLVESTAVEETCGRLPRKNLYGDQLTPSTTATFKKNVNSIRVSPSLRQPSIAGIFDDSSTVEERRRNPFTSWYEDTSNNSSPLPKNRHNTEDTMHLREASQYPKTPTPFTSPLAKQGSRRQKRNSLRSSSYEASKYIEHLEYQLASTQSQLETYTSPATTHIDSAKLRMLTKESDILRREVSEWEQRFTERVEELVNTRIQSTTTLKAKVARLEHELECRDSLLHSLEGAAETSTRRIKELERHAEKAGRRLKNMEALEITNRDLARRVDVLTELLAHSPTVRHTHSGASSPDRSVARSLPPRPRSMMPRLPSSPGAGAGVGVGVGAGAAVHLDFDEVPDLAPVPATAPAAWEAGGPDGGEAGAGMSCPFIMPSHHALLSLHHTFTLSSPYFV